MTGGSCPTPSSAALYEAGATLVELGERHLAEAGELHSEGLTLMEVGLRFGVSQQTVRRALATEGVAIRPSGRRVQATT